MQKWTFFETIITSFIFLEIFHYTTAVSKYLQSKELDFITVINLIKTLLSDIRKGSSNYDRVKEKAINFVSIKNNCDKIKKLENIFIEETFINKRRPKIKKMPGEKALDDVRNISPHDYFKVNTHRRIYDVLINVFEKNEKIYEVLGTFNTQRFIEFAKSPHLINDDNFKYVAFKSNAESGIALKEEFLQFISYFNQTFNKIAHKSNTKSQS